MLGMGIANTICPLMKTFAGLLVYCTIFGFFEGCYVCQVAVITGDIVGIDRMAVAVGILFGIKSIPLTLGPPIAGKFFLIIIYFEISLQVYQNAMNENSLFLERPLDILMIDSLSLYSLFIGFLYDVADSYQVAFYVAGAIPVIASVIMFAIPFLVPPKDDSFWDNPSSKQYLVQDSSAASSHTHTTTSNSKGITDKNNNHQEESNNTAKTMRSTTTLNTQDLCDIDSLDCIDIGGGDTGPLQPLQPNNNNNTSLYASRFLITTKEDPSFTSICSFQLAAPTTTTTNTNGAANTNLGTLSDNMSRLSIRGLGSISSFGSVVFSPVSPLNQAQCSNLLVVDRVTNV